MTILKILLLLAIILSGNFFEELERERPKLFWGLTIGLATVFTQLDDNSLTHNPSLAYTEQILVSGESDSGQSNPSFISGRPDRELVKLIKELVPDQLPETVEGIQGHVSHGCQPLDFMVLAHVID